MAWGRVRAWAGAIALAILVAGCAGPPPTAIAEFGTAAKKTVDLVGEARATGLALDDAVAAEGGAKFYLDTGRVSLHPRSTCIVDRAQWELAVFKPRLEAFKAVAAYADALSKATDPGAIDKIKAAGSGVLTAVAPAGAATPVVQWVIGSGLQAASAAQVRGVMREVHPALVIVETQFAKEDLPKLVGLYRACLESWEGLRHSNLNTMRSSGASAVARHDAYLRSVSEAAALRARVEALAKGEEVLADFVSKHEKLMTSDAGINEIVAQLDGLAAAVAPGTSKPDDKAGDKKSGN